MTDSEAAATFVRPMEAAWVCALVVWAAGGIWLGARRKKHFLGTRRQWMGEGDLDPALHSPEGRRLLRIERWYGVIGFVVVVVLWRLSV